MRPFFLFLFGAVFLSSSLFATPTLAPDSSHWFRRYQIRGTVYKHLSDGSIIERHGFLKRRYLSPLLPTVGGASVACAGAIAFRDVSLGIAAVHGLFGAVGAFFVTEVLNSWGGLFYFTDPGDFADDSLFKLKPGKFVSSLSWLLDKRKAWEIRENGTGTAQKIEPESLVLIVDQNNVIQEASLKEKNGEELDLSKIIPVRPLVKISPNRPDR
jgi:hypothetical protein